MFCKKFFSRSLLSLFAFNALNVMVPTNASENCRGKSNESEDKEDLDNWFFEQWCQNYSFDKKVNKKHDDFMNALEKHNNLMNDCEVTLKKDIEEIYKEIFKAVYDDVSFNGLFLLSEGCLNDTFIPQQLLEKYTNVKNFHGIEFSSYKDSLGVKIYSYKYIYPASCGGKRGKLIFTIEIAQTMLYKVDLKFISCDSANK